MFTRNTWNTCITTEQNPDPASREAEVEALSNIGLAETLAKSQSRGRSRSQSSVNLYYT